MRQLKFVMLAVLAVIGLAACAPAASSGAEGEPGLSGDVTADGSSTVFPLMTAAVEEYNATQPDVRVSVGESGTGGGFKKFCGIGQAPSTDISDASRPIKAEEADVCAANGVEYAEILVALDGLTVVVNPANDAVECLTVEQLGHLFRPEDGENADTWADIDPAWPGEPIKFFVPDPDSGTRDFFVEAIIEGGLGLAGDAANIRQDNNTEFNSDDNILLQGVAGEETGLGFFGFAYYINNTDKVKAVAVDGGDGCVLPTTETVQDGSYKPLSRPLYIYVNKASLVEEPQVADLVNYLLTEGFAIVMEDVGYSFPPDGTYEAGLAAVEEAMK